MYAFLISPVPTTFLANYIALDLIILTLNEEYKLWRFSLCDFLQPFVISSLIGPNALHGPRSQTPSEWHIICKATRNLHFCIGLALIFTFASGRHKEGCALFVQCEYDGFGASAECVSRNMASAKTRYSLTTRQQSPLLALYPTVPGSGAGCAVWGCRRTSQYLSSPQLHFQELLK
jgi:hypothetical protein